MKKSLLVLVVLAMTVSFAFAQANKGAATINLKEAWNVTGKKEPVMFDHAFHQGKLQCVDCHESAEGGKIKLEGEIKGLNDKNPAHANCWSCHTERKVSVGKTCTKCHVKQ